MINPNQTLGQLATEHPAAQQVFLRHGLDFCCGGKRMLAEACQAAALDPSQVLAEIAAEDAPEEPRRWGEQPVSELVDFIVSRYHDTLRQQLPGLVAAAKKVERVHAAKPSCPRGLAEHLERLDEELRQHMLKEEQVLFPALRSGSRGEMLHMPVRVMMQEHEDHGANLRELRALATSFVAPAEACATWRALYAGLEKLEAELMAHISLENNVLFPRALAARGAGVE